VKKKTRKNPILNMEMSVMKNCLIIIKRKKISNKRPNEVVEAFKHEHEPKDSNEKISIIAAFLYIFL